MQPDLVRRMRGPFRPRRGKGICDLHSGDDAAIGRTLREVGPSSERRRARHARIRDRVADVGQSADIDHQPLEAKAEATMWHRAVTAEIAVPLVVRRVESELAQAVREARADYQAGRVDDKSIDGHIKRLRRHA